VVAIAILVDTAIDIDIAVAVASSGNLLYPSQAKPSPRTEKTPNYHPSVSATAILVATAIDIDSYICSFFS
jgi:hypothetical protein